MRRGSREEHVGFHLNAEGIIIPVPTPFTDSLAVDDAALEALLSFYLEKRVGGLFLLGSYGMGPALTVEERKTVAERAVRLVAGQIPVIIHVGTADTATTVALAEHATRLGCDAIAVVPPYYYRHTEGEVAGHFGAVVAATSLPLVVYDNPAFSGFEFRREFLEELIGRHPSLVGIKVAYPDGEAMRAIKKIGGERFQVYSGYPSFIVSRQSVGVSGVINPPTTSIPEVLQTLWAADPSSPAAHTLQAAVNDFCLLMERLGTKLGRGAQREALTCRGLKIVRYPRWPVPDVRDEDRRALQAAIDNILAVAERVL